MTATLSASVDSPPRAPLTAAGIPELLRVLGDVPAERVLLDPPPGQATEEDLIRRVDGDDKILCELVDGTLVEKAMGYREGLLALAIGAFLREFVNARNLGMVAGADAMLRMMGGNIRLPDVSYSAWSDVPGGKVPTQAVGRFPATLAIEVLSKGNTRREMQKKYREFFDSGTRQVWEINPDSRTVAIYNVPDAEPAKILQESEILSGGPLLPGFELPLARLFAELDRQAGQGGQAV
jgi:Uma2 family endonuclease